MIQTSFKEVKTGHIIYLDIDPSWTLNTFINTLSPILCEHFKIPPLRLDIVKAGQKKSEYAQRLLPTDDCLTAIWGETLTNLAFYVRKRDDLYRRFRKLNNNNEISIRRQIGQCPVCLETMVSLISMYNCSHTICLRCYRSCEEVDHATCPLCQYF